MSLDSTSHMLRVSIESQQFPGSYLRIDGTGVTTFSGSGGGTVNCQNYVGTYETLVIVNYPEDNTFSLLSSVFPNVYLRMDGSEVKSGETYPSGIGTVNCQFGSQSYEKFRLEDQDDGSKAIVSAEFPNAYLRMENETSKGGSAGAGIVNCQSYVGTYEKFKIHII
ncbi:hypothetical protein DPV78_012825 [Talaromyces pinophilus]|nr:hypothetical protein DPV78_012825 [Talaromyces pinophilus]